MRQHRRSACSGVEFVRDLAEPFGIAAQDGDLGSAFGEKRRNSLTDPAATSGDQN
jgi:hypothetical protein